MNRTEARAALDELEIEYPKSGAGSGLDSLLELLPNEHMGTTLGEPHVEPGDTWWVFHAAPENHNPDLMVRPGTKHPGKGPGPGSFKICADADLPAWARPVADKMRQPKKG